MRPAPLVIIGLDGASFNLLDPMMTKGLLPNLARLSESGLRTDLLSTLPAATLPAWTSFLTASSPSVHGVTDIFMRDGYGLVPSNGTFRTMPTFLSRLAASGLDVACLGVPGTFPPEPLPGGVCVAGFDAPGVSQAGARAIWPPDYAARLRELGGWRYATFNEHAHGPHRLQRAVDALLADIAVKERVVLDLHARHAWDVFFVHLQASDTAAHHLWHTYDRASPRYLEALRSDGLPRVYERLDALIGRLCAQAPEHARVLVVSDHGMAGASTTAIHLNRWLCKQGLLRFHEGRRQRWRAALGQTLRRIIGVLPPRLLSATVRALPRDLLRGALQAARGSAVDFAQTTAFSDELDYAPAIWLNTRERFAHGRVDRATADALRVRLRDELLTLRCPHTGEALVKAVHPRDSLPEGPHRDRFPDLLIEPAWPRGYRPSFLTSGGPGPVVETLTPERFTAPKGFGMPGVHRREGVFMAAGEGIPATDIPALHIAEAGALVYAMMGVAPPPEADAQVPAHLAQMVLGEQDAVVGHHDCAAAMTAEPYSAADSVQLTKRLQSLGYID